MLLLYQRLLNGNGKNTNNKNGLLMTKTDKHNSMKKVGIMEKMTQLKHRNCF